MDIELFELCKEVYERTKWDSNELRHKLGDDIYDRELFDSDVNDEHPRDSYLPLYTSDYLLEKLPKGLTLTHFKDLSYIEREHAWSARLTPALGRYATGDTPLKALLKLTIALHEVGELK